MKQEKEEEEINHDLITWKLLFPSLWFNNQCIYVLICTDSLKEKNKDRNCMSEQMAHIPASTLILKMENSSN